MTFSSRKTLRKNMYKSIHIVVLVLSSDDAAVCFAFVCAEPKCVSPEREAREVQYAAVIQFVPSCLPTTAAAHEPAELTDVG